MTKCPEWCIRHLLSVSAEHKDRMIADLKHADPDLYKAIIERLEEVRQEQEKQNES